MLKIGIIGAGRIGKVHLESISYHVKNATVVAVADPFMNDETKAFIEGFGVEKIYTDYKKIIEDKDIDAVLVCSSTDTHAPISIEAINAGKHVFCEKPITVNYPLSAEMANEAEKQGKMLNIGVCNRYQRSVEMLRQLNDEGKFGDIYSVYCSFRSYRSIPGLGGPFTTKAQSGGGVLIDWGIHFLDLILYVLGGAKLKTVTCDAYNELAKNMKEYNYAGHGMWAEDTADIEHGTNDVEEYITGYIRTDKASISFNGAWAQNIDANDMFIDFMGDKGGARLSYGGKFTFYDGKTLETIKPEYDIPDMYLCEDKAFIESINTGKKDKNNIENILESMKLLQALYDSSDKKEEIKL